MNEIESAISEAGGFLWYQLALVLSSLVPLSLVGANMGASVFVAMVPDARCKTPAEDSIVKDCPTDFQTFLVPNVPSGEPSLCERYNYMDRNISSMYLPIKGSDNSTVCNITTDTEFPETVTCIDWVFDKDVMRSTIVTDFQLMCGDRWAGYFAQSALMIGVGLGSMSAGSVSDRFGRRHAFLFACLGSILFGVALAFTQTYVTFCIVRTLLGFFVYSCFPVLFVLNSELTSPKHRSLSGQILELGFPFGFMFLSLMSYLLREWRKVQIAITAPFAIGILMWWLIPESPRWLYNENKKEEAIATITRMAEVNRKEPKTNRKTKRELPGISTTSAPTKVDDIVTPAQTSVGELNHSITEAFMHPHLRCACLKFFYIWFTVSCVYYGLTLNVAELGSDPFTDLCLNSVAEIVGDAIAVPLLNVAGRRMTYCLSAGLAGVFCIVVAFAPGGALAIAILGKLAISIAFGATYIHTNEVFPTEIRTSGIAICSAMARVGGVASPLIAMSGIVVTELPYVIFGVLAVVAALLVLTLPETRGIGLPQTMEEGEAFIATSRWFRASCATRQSSGQT